MPGTRPDSKVERELGAIATNLAAINSREAGIQRQLNQAREDRGKLFEKLETMHVEAKAAIAGHESRITTLERDARNHEPHCDLVVRHEEQLDSLRQWRRSMWSKTMGLATAIAAAVSAAILAIKHLFSGQ